MTPGLSQGQTGFGSIMNRNIHIINTVIQITAATAVPTNCLLLLLL